MKSKLYYGLLETIEKQDEMICKQNKLVAKLVNENIHKR